jgi:hypothetical protein
MYKTIPIPKRVVGAILATAAATLFALAPAAPAQADTFGLCDVDHGCLPDNFTHTYCITVGVNVVLTNAIHAAMENLDNQTSYSDVFFSCPSFPNVADAIWQQSTTISARGDYLCQRFNSAGLCIQARLRLNPNLLTDTANRRKTACHEIGHSVGLKHGTDADNNLYNDCMKSGPVVADQLFDQYDSHHVTHINNRA